MFPHQESGVWDAGGTTDSCYNLLTVFQLFRLSSGFTDVHDIVNKLFRFSVVYSVQLLRAVSETKSEGLL